MSSPVAHIHTHEQHTLAAMTSSHSFRICVSMFERLTQPHVVERIAACGDCNPVAS